MNFIWLRGKCSAGDSYLIPIKLPDNSDVYSLDIDLIKEYDFGEFEEADIRIRELEFSHIETRECVPYEWNKFASIQFDLYDFLNTVTVQRYVVIRYNPEIGGMGLYTTKKFLKWSVVLHLSGPVLDHPTRESIHVGNGQHVVDPYGSYVNHSFEPSTYVEGYDLIALRDMDSGTEVTFNYNESEADMACPFQVDGQWVRGNFKEL